MTGPATRFARRTIKLPADRGDRDPARRQERPDQIVRVGLGRRDLAGIERPERQGGQQDRPERQCLERCHATQEQRQPDRGEVRQDEQRPSVHPVGQEAGRDPEHEQGAGAEGEDQSDGTGVGADQPDQGDRADTDAEGRDRV